MKRTKKDVSYISRLHPNDEKILKEKYDILIELDKSTPTVTLRKIPRCSKRDKEIKQKILSSEDILKFFSEEVKKSKSKYFL